MPGNPHQGTQPMFPITFHITFPAPTIRRNIHRFPQPAHRRGKPATKQSYTSAIHPPRKNSPYPHYPFVKSTHSAGTSIGRHGNVPPQISSPGWRARPQTIVYSRAAYISIYDAFGASENAISYKVGVPDPITAPHLCIAIEGQTDKVGRSTPRRGNLILATRYPQRSSAPAITNIARRGYVPSQISPPCWR